MEDQEYEKEHEAQKIRLDDDDDLSIGTMY